MLSTIVVTSALKGAIGLVGTGLWLVPLLIAGLSYYHYDQLGTFSKIHYHSTEMIVTRVRV